MKNEGLTESNCSTNAGDKNKRSNENDRGMKTRTSAECRNEAEEIRAKPNDEEKADWSNKKSICNRIKPDHISFA